MLEKMATAVYVDDLKVATAFYCDLLGLVAGFESDWIVQLSSPDKAAIELMLQPKNHNLVPQGFQKSPQGSSLVFVVGDCDQYHKKAVSMGLTIIQAPKNEAYGQRRFLTVDPDGLLIDISSQCEPSAEFIAKYMSG